MSRTVVRKVNDRSVFVSSLPSRGATGQSAYQAAVAAGYSGTEAEFGASFDNFEDAVVTAVAAADEATTVVRDFFPRATINLFNKDAAVLNKDLWFSGAVRDSAGNWVSELIPAQPSTLYTARYPAGGYGYSWHALNGSGVVIGESIQSGSNYTTPALTTHIRLGGPITASDINFLDLTMLFEGDGLLPDIINYVPGNVRELGDKIVERKYEGKTCAFMGDSLTAIIFSASGKTALRLGFINRPHNDNIAYPGNDPRTYGIAGSAIMRRPDVEASQPAFAGTAFCDRYKFLDTSRDFVCIAGGTNDQYSTGLGASIGTWDAQWALYQQEMADPANDGKHPLDVEYVEYADRQSLYGAMIVLLMGVKRMFPNKPVRFITPPPNQVMYGKAWASAANPADRLDLPDFSDVLEDVCRRIGVPCFHTIRAGTGLFPLIPENFAINFDDAVHLSNEGQELWADARYQWEMTLGRY